MTTSKIYLLHGGYPENWKEISRNIREDRAGLQCEWIDENGKRCERKHMEPIPGNAKGSKTILTTAHLNHNPSDCRPENLRAWCQQHHLSYDAQMHARNAKITRQNKQAEYYDASLFADVSPSIEDTCYT